LGHPEALDRIRRKLKSSGGEDAKAAVAIIFNEEGGRLELLLVKRARVPGDPWSGDMAFPGGKRIHSDGDMMETVSREVLEETGIDLGLTEFLGTLETVYSAVRPQMGVLPMLFLVEELPEIVINEELSSYHWTEFDKLRWRRGRGLVKGHDVPVFHIDREWVWGLTYGIVERLLALSEED
jgi:8-oxo-dGTP diphosphatase